MINLEKVTLVCVTSVNVDRPISVLKCSCKGITFGDLLLLTDKDVSPNGIKTTQ